MAQIRVEYIVLKDKFIVVQALKSANSKAPIKFSGGDPGQLAKPFFQTCKKFLDECCSENLPKLGVEASIYYAGLVRPYELYCRVTKVDIDKASEQINITKAILENCLHPEIELSRPRN